VRRVFVFAREYARLTEAAIDHATADSRSAVVRVHGSVPTSGALVYVHWSPDGRPRPWEERSLRAAREADLGVCVVVNLDPGVDSPASAWAGCSDAVVDRSNRGRDLAAYRDGVRCLQAAGHRGPIALANDSVLWRDDAHATLVARAKEVGAQVVAATSNDQPFPHLQTPWLWVDGSVAPRDLARLVGMWRNVRTRRAAIEHGELTFTRAATGLGLSTQALFSHEAALAELLREVDSDEGAPPDTVARRLRVRRDATAGTALNPTHFLWSELLALGYPGLKRDLLRSNPAGVEDWFRIRTVATAHGFDPADIPASPFRPDLLSRIRARRVR
jgi:hypothetical protein